MGEAETKSLRLAALIPLSGSARAFVHEVCLFARRMEAEVRFYFAGEESLAARSTVLSLFPDGMAPDREHLEIRDVAADELVEEVVNRDRPDIMVIEGLEREEEEILAPRELAHLMRDLPCSFLLLSGCTTKGRRLRRVACSLRLDEHGEEMLDFCDYLCRRCYADHLYLVREVRDAKKDIVPTESVIEMEEEMLGAFVGDRYDPAAVSLAAIFYLEGEGLFNYSRGKEAELVIMPAPGRNDTFWSRLFDARDEPYYSKLPCWLLLHRQKGSVREG